MNSRFCKVCFYLLCTLYTNLTLADSQIHVEVAPAYFAYDGYGIDVGYSLPKSNVSIGLSLARMGDFPGFAKSFFYESNRLDDLDIAWEQAIGIQSRYYFNEPTSGFYLGALLAKEKWSVKFENQTTDTDNKLFAVVPGYIFRPLNNREFTVNLQLYAMYNFAKEENYYVKDVEFKLKDFSVIGNILLGYRF